MKISLKAARVNAGMTQKEAGKVLNMSKDVIKLMEKGIREPKVSEYDALCGAYGCSKDDIFLPSYPTYSEIRRRRQKKHANANDTKGS